MSQNQMKISIRVNDQVYLKDPESSELGHKIVKGSVDLIFDLGSELFTFKKLAQYIGSTEASVYRYFESKHKLLLYLSSWYWTWMEYRLTFDLSNINTAKEKLGRAIALLCKPKKDNLNVAHLNIEKLNSIVISEASKAYLTKEVDKECRRGVFVEYEGFVEKMSQLILEVNPSYKYPHMLVSTVIEGVHQQHFYAEHIPALTDAANAEDTVIMDFYREMIFKLIQN